MNRCWTGLASRMAATVAAAAVIVVVVTVAVVIVVVVVVRATVATCGGIVATEGSVWDCYCELCGTLSVWVGQAWMLEYRYRWSFEGNSVHDLKVQSVPFRTKALALNSGIVRE